MLMHGVLTESQVDSFILGPVPSETVMSTEIHNTFRTHVQK